MLCHTSRRSATEPALRHWRASHGHAVVRVSLFCCKITLQRYVFNKSHWKTQRHMSARVCVCSFVGYRAAVMWCIGSHFLAGGQTHVRKQKTIELMCLGLWALWDRVHLSGLFSAPANDTQASGANEERRPHFPCACSHTHAQRNNFH